MVKIAMAQMCATNNAEDNFAVVERLVKRASDAGAALISLPECFEFMGTNAAESQAFATTLADELFQKYCGLAATHKIWISYGGFHEKQPGGEAGPNDARICNSHTLVSSAGKLVANYRKTHLFDVDIADGKFAESSFTKKGEEMVVITDTPAMNVGLTTCYDLRFPMLFQQLRSAGADLILVPSAFMCGTGKAHWETLLRARAIETQCYVAAAAQFGAHHAKRSSYGHTIIVDPWGEVLAEMDGESEGIIVAEMDPARLASVRGKMPVLSHRRPELYATEVKIIPAKP